MQDLETVEPGYRGALILAALLRVCLYIAVRGTCTNKPSIEQQELTLLDIQAQQFQDLASAGTLDRALDVLDSKYDWINLAMIEKGFQPTLEAPDIDNSLVTITVADVITREPGQAEIRRPTIRFVTKHLSRQGALLTKYEHVPVAAIENGVMSIEPGFEPTDVNLVCEQIQLRADAQEHNILPNLGYQKDTIFDAVKAASTAMMAAPRKH